MGELIVCTGKYAKTPYFVSAVCMNVYCIEELCYLFALNPFVITQDIMDMSLVNWIEEECELGELAVSLKELFRKGSQVGEFVNIIMNYVNYCEPEEISIIEETLESNSGLSEFERKKHQGDYLLRNEKYELAIEEYEALLSVLPEMERELRGLIYHNIGYAYANMLMFDIASKYFKRAYDISSRIESLMQYLSSLRMYMSEEKYLSLVTQNEEYRGASLKLESYLKKAADEFETSEENRMLSALSILKDEGKISTYYDEIDKVILSLKEDYLRMVLD